MAKKSSKSKVGASAAALEPRGKKIVFDAEPSVDGDDSENEEQSPTGEESRDEDAEDAGSEEEEQTDSDDDDAAPEAVGFAVDQRKARAEAEAEEAYVFLSTL